MKRIINSAISQVGRDLGKVASNHLFKDAHATPHRIIGTENNTSRTTRSKFEKHIDFDTSFRPNTLINKLAGAYTELKNQVSELTSAELIDLELTDTVLSNVQKLINKTDDVQEVLYINADKNKNEIESLENIISRSNQLFKNIFNKIIFGCEQRKKFYVEELNSNPGVMSFIKFVGFNAIWMGNYALTGVKNLQKTVIGNILALFVFPIAHIVAAIFGMFNYSSYKRNTNNNLERNKLLINLENQRIETIQSILNTL